MSDDGYTEVETSTQYGCRLPIGVVRWNPRGEPCTEEEARWDARREGGTVVRRVTTTAVIVSEWFDADVPAPAAVSYE